jgi:predicted RNase H-like nuclease
VRVIGVDLAWAEHNRTGLCAVEDDRVIDSGVAGDDGEVIGWIDKHGAEASVVAFDAPLIVENHAGCRGCERVIASAWGRAHASCHVANRQRPWFAAGGRAGRLARRLHLVLDPAASPATRRVAIEVYPHTALVSLFGLPSILKYKAKRSRTVDDRRGEFLRFVDCLLMLRDRTPRLDVTTSPGWIRLVAMVADARTGAQLDLVEDELDAYVCAYVALYYEQRRGSRECAVIGDGRTGYVVTPVDQSRWDMVRIAGERYGVTIG